MIKEQSESESSDGRETAKSEAWDCIEKIRFALGYDELELQPEHEHERKYKHRIFLQLMWKW